MALKTFWSCGMDNIVILILSNPKHAPCEIRLHCGRSWPAAYINIIQNTHQILVLTEALFRAQAIFYLLPNNEWGTKYRGLTYSAK